MKKPLITVVIPAHNEEQYLGRCIRAVWIAARELRPEKVQVIVSANRCTDQTAEIARQAGAQVVENDADTIAGVRNAAAAKALGEILVTVDADTCMAPSALAEVRDKLDSGRFIGGGAVPRFDRMSLGIICSSAYVALKLLPRMLRGRFPAAGCIFWCRKADFDALGGFDESLCSLEDADFAKRLCQLGRTRGQKYGVLCRGFAVTSARKFDRFGDWYLIRNRDITDAIFTGTDRSAANRFYYDVR